MPIRRYKSSKGIDPNVLVNALPVGAAPTASAPSPVPYVDISFTSVGNASDDLDEMMERLGYVFVEEGPTDPIFEAASADAPPTSSFLLPDSTVLPLNLIAEGEFLQRSGGNIVGTASIVTPHDLAGAEHIADTLANLNALITDATLDDVSGSRTPTVHALAGALHSSSTLAQLNALVSDATLDDTNDPRTPTGAASGQLGGTYPGPDVRGVRETSGPTLLTFGAVADGEALVRSAATIVSAPFTNITNSAPANVDKSAAAAGVATDAARADHKHDINTGTPGGIAVGDAAAEGAATTLARSDHTHALAAPAAPANVTKAAASAGVATTVARADHKHDISTAAPGTAGVGTTSGEGSASTLARSDHTHQSNTAPVNVTKAAAAIGTSTEPARADHKHDATTATAVAASVGQANAEGSSTSLARADHTHQHTAGTPVQVGTANAAGSSGNFAHSDHIHQRVMQAGYLDGLVPTHFSVTQVQIGAGRCRSDDDTLDIVVASTLTAAITSSGANGLDTGTEASNTWYSVWVIADSNGVNPVAALLSVQSTTPTMPTGYDKKRRVGWVRNDGSSNFRVFNVVRSGRQREVRYDNVVLTALQVLSGGTATTFTDIDLTAFVPPTSRDVLLWGDCYGSTLADYTAIRTNGVTLETAARIPTGDEATGETRGGGPIWLRTDSGRLIEYANSSAFSDTQANFWVYGYMDEV